LHSDPARVHRDAINIQHNSYNLRRNAFQNSILNSIGRAPLVKLNRKTA